VLADFQAQMVQTGDQVMAAILKRAAERGENTATTSPRECRSPLRLSSATRSPAQPRGDEHAITEIVDQVFLPLVSR